MKKILSVMFIAVIFVSFSRVSKAVSFSSHISAEIIKSVSFEVEDIDLGVYDIADSTGGWGRTKDFFIRFHNLKPTQVINISFDRDNNLFFGDLSLKNRNDSSKEFEVGITFDPFIPSTGDSTLIGHVTLYPTFLTAGEYRGSLTININYN